MRDVFIFGVGRSGTTMVYGFCQRVFQHLVGKNYRSIYEPYIWNSVLFNKPYEECAEHFGKTSSISIEGIHNHLNTPLFSSENPDLKALDDDFYQKFMPSGDSVIQVVKLIRGNGRMALFRQLNPEAKFIVMIRNPIDVVNSVKYKSSFFGDDFYPSDYPRFCQELKETGSLTTDPESASWAERHAEYCYQMNRAALEFSAHDQNTMVFEYDNFAKDKAAAMGQVLRFLELPEEPEFLAHLEAPIGPTTPSVSLSESEFNAIARFEELHDVLCMQAGIRRSKAGLEVLKQYKGQCTNDDYDENYDGLTTNPLRRVIWRLKTQIRGLEEKLASQESETCGSH